MTPRQFLAQYERDNAYDRYHDTYGRGLSPRIAKQLYKILKKSKSETSKKIVRMYFEDDYFDMDWDRRGLTPQDTREIYKILNVKMRHYLDDERNNPMKHNPKKKKAFVPTGKSAIRQAILKVLQNGNKSLAKDTSNVTLKHIQQYLGNFPELFTPSALQSGAKFVRDIRDKSTDEEGAKLFKKGGQKYKTLLRFAEMLEHLKQPSKEYRSPQARYQRKAEQASKEAVRDLKGKVMGQISRLYMVILTDTRNNERILGGFASAPSARSAARAYMTGIKKAYDPLIPTFKSRQTKTGRTSNIRSKLKIDVEYITHQVKGKEKRTGEAVYSFENNGALKYLKDTLGKSPITVRVRLITHKQDHKQYWKLFNSPAVGQLRWNPKKR